MAGTSITVAVGGTTTNVLIDYTSAGQVAAILPSTTPVGNGTLTLIFGGKSGSIPITVVASNFGIVTADNSGSGPAVVTFGNFSAVTISNSAKPGDTLILWGTGLGANAASESSPTGAAGGDLPAQIQVFVGGVSAQILYQGRTPTAVGLDQINFTVPADAPLGCNVSIIVQTTAPTATMSHGPTMSIASTDGSPCSDPTQIVPSSFLPGSTTKVAVVQPFQNVSLNVTGSGTSTTTSEIADVSFVQFSQSQLTSAAPTLNTEPAPGSCLTGVIRGSGSIGVSGPPVATYLNGGSSGTLNPPSSPAITLPRVTSGSATIYLNETLTTAMPSGTWGFSNAGGPDVGADFGKQVHHSAGRYAGNAGWDRTRSQAFKSRPISIPTPPSRCRVSMRLSIPPNFRSVPR